MIAPQLFPDQEALLGFPRRPPRGVPNGPPQSGRGGKTVGRQERLGPDVVRVILVKPLEFLVVQVVQTIQQPGPFILNQHHGL